jgi:hypothetical protein
MPVSDVRGVRFPPSSRSSGYFHTSLGGKLSSRNCAPSQRILDPRAWILTFGYLVRIERLSGAPGKARRGISKVEGKMVRGRGASRH